MSVTPSFIKLKISNWVRGTFHGNYDNAPDASLPTDPADRKSRNVAGICTPIDSLGWPGSKVKGLTHLYAQSGIANAEKVWTMLANEIEKATTCTQFDQTRPAPTLTQAYDAGFSTANNYAPQSVFSDELTDGSESICPNIYWNIAQRFYEGYYAGMGSPSLDIFNSMGGYMAGQNNISPKSFEIDFGGTRQPLNPYFLNGYSSQAAARKMFNFHTGDTTQDWDFFQRNLHTKTNLLTQCYVGLNSPDERDFCYSVLAETGRKYLSGIKRTVGYAAPWSQSVGLASDVQWKNSGYIHKYPAGSDNYFLVRDWHFSTIWGCSFVGFFMQLIAEGWVFFDSLRYNQSKDWSKMALDTDLRGNGRFQWVTNNGTPEPTLWNGSDKYPTRPLTNVDMTIEMYHWFLKVWPIFKAAGGPRHLVHTANGANVPIQYGDLGDFVITADKLNYNQTTYYHLADTRKGLCIGAEIGNNYAIAYYNPYKGPLKSSSEEIIVSLPSGRKINIGKLTGKTVHVVYA